MNSHENLTAHILDRCTVTQRFWTFLDDATRLAEGLATLTQVSVSPCPRCGVPTAELAGPPASHTADDMWAFLGYVMEVHDSLDLELTALMSPETIAKIDELMGRDGKPLAPSVLKAADVAADLAAADIEYEPASLVDCIGDYLGCTCEK